MSADVELVRQAYEALNQRDLDRLDSYADPEIVYTNAAGLPGAGVHRGRAAARRDLERQLEAWRQLRYEPVEIVERGGDVVVLVEMTALGMTSGVPITVRFGHVWSVSGGRVTAVTAYLSHAEALEQAGSSA